MSGDTNKQPHAGDTVEDHQIGFAHGMSRSRDRLLEWAKGRKVLNATNNHGKYTPTKFYQIGYDEALNHLIDELNRSA